METLKGSVGLGAACHVFVDSESELALEISGHEMCGVTRNLLFTPIAAAGPPDLQLEVLESRLDRPPTPSSASLGLDSSPPPAPEEGSPFLCHSHAHLLVLFFKLLRCRFTGDEAFWWWRW